MHGANVIAWHRLVLRVASLQAFDVRSSSCASLLATLAYRWTPWKPEIYPDYDAPIVGYVDGQFEPLIAGFGFWPSALQKANIKRAREQGRKPPLMRSTMNATITLGSLRCTDQPGAAVDVA